MQYVCGIHVCICRSARLCSVQNHVSVQAAVRLSRKPPCCALFSSASFCADECSASLGPTYMPLACTGIWFGTSMLCQTVTNSLTRRDPLIWLISIVTLITTPFIATHEPPSTAQPPPPPKPLPPNLNGSPVPESARGIGRQETFAVPS